MRARLSSAYIVCEILAALWRAPEETKGTAPFRAHIEVKLPYQDLTLPPDDFAEKYVFGWVADLLTTTRAAPRFAPLQLPSGHEGAIETFGGMQCRIVRVYHMGLGYDLLRIDLEYRPPVAAEATAEAA